MDIDGNRLVVTSDSGVYIYLFDGTNWVEEAQILVPPFTESVIDVAISGDLVLTGCPNDDEAGNNSGTAYVFRREGSSWIQETRLTASDAAEDDRFGEHVALDGDRAVVGAQYHDDVFNNSGAIYVYRREGTSWVQEAKLIHDEVRDQARLGRDVAIDGDLIVGVSTHFCPLFRRSDTSWTQQGRVHGGYLGSENSVALDIVAGLIVLGQESYDPYDYTGRATVYRREGTSKWHVETYLTAPNAMEGDYFGSSVAVNGNTILVGATRDDGWAGSAHVFRYDGLTWNTTRKLIASDRVGGEGIAGGDGFGYSVALQGHTAVIGGRGHDHFGFNAGATYVYDDVTRFFRDCNNNFVDDVCQLNPVDYPDCNDNGIADILDIYDATSFDCNENCVPDECEPAEDCNENSIQDICDIGQGTSEDCNTNGTPDECESPDDCNENNIQDICDIAGGASSDCNLNGSPDECELSGDCNENNIPDICELVFGSGTDCNTNEILDECDIVSNPGSDCNQNNLPDACDLNADPSLDCNLNLVPDSCDIAEGTSRDSDGNGRPDECCPIASQPALHQQFDPLTGDSTGPPEPKNRVLAVKAGDAGMPQTIRVTWDAMPNWLGGHAGLIGQQKWMTQPFQVCENSADGLAVSPPNCGPAPGQPQKWFWAARLTCDLSTAHFTDLASLRECCTGTGEACTTDSDCAAGTCGVDGAIHFLDQGIVPSKNDTQQAVYSVQAIDQACEMIENDYSDALVVTQPVWGDIGYRNTCPMLPPDGVADLIPDVTRALSKFSNALCAPKKMRADVEPAILDMQINTTDVLQLLNAFSSGSASYGFEAGPACSDGG